MVCLCFIWFDVEDDGLLDYVQVLHQFSFVALNQQTALRVNLEINAFAMPVSVLNNLAEAMKVLDGKQNANRSEGDITEHVLVLEMLQQFSNTQTYLNKQTMS